MTCPKSLLKDRDEGQTRSVKTQALWDVRLRGFSSEVFEKALTVTDVAIHQFPASL